MMPVYRPSQTSVGRAFTNATTLLTVPPSAVVHEDEQEPELGVAETDVGGAEDDLARDDDQLQCGLCGGDVGGHLSSPSGGVVTVRVVFCPDCPGRTTVDERASSRSRNSRMTSASACALARTAWHRSGV